MDKVWNSVLSLRDRGLPPKKYTTELTNQLATLFSPGSFCYYIFNYETKDFDYIHPDVERLLGINPEQFSFENYKKNIYYKDLVNIEKKEALVNHFLLNHINHTKILNYKSVYQIRINNRRDGYKSLLYQSIVLSTTPENKISKVLVIFTDLHFLEITFDHKVSFIGYNGEPSWYCLELENPVLKQENFHEIFTKREKEILKHLGEGMSTAEIAEHLCLSENTVQTHRKNILLKTSCRSSNELLAKCAREGLI